MELTCDQCGNGAKVLRGRKGDNTLRCPACLGEEAQASGDAPRPENVELRRRKKVQAAARKLIMINQLAGEVDRDIYKERIRNLKTALDLALSDCLALRDALTQQWASRFHGCITGDCPHSNYQSCLNDLVDDAKEMAESADAVLKSTNPGQSLLDHLKSMEADLAASRADLQSREADCAAMRKALEKVQWGGDCGQCPDCCSLQKVGHLSMCEVGGALGSQAGQQAELEPPR